MSERDFGGETKQPGTEWSRSIDVVTEANWEELMARGFEVLKPCVTPEDLPRYLPDARDLIGEERVATGDAFDETEQRPLRLKPGRGIYLRPYSTHYKDMLSYNKAALWKERGARAEVEDSDGSTS
jgi:hypothetical protein